MYDCDYYMILYVNYAKQGWNMTDEQYEKTPDIRAFCEKVTDKHNVIVFDKAVLVKKDVRENISREMDIGDYTFNNFKRATAESLSDEEVSDLERTVEQAKHSSLPKWQVASYVEAVNDIKRLRGDK